MKAMKATLIIVIVGLALFGRTFGRYHKNNLATGCRGETVRPCDIWRGYP
jgi:hypothetical protein